MTKFTENEARLLAAKSRAAIAMHQSVSNRGGKPKVVFELPAGDKREIKIGYSDMKDGELHLCVYIVDAAAEPVPTDLHAAIMNLPCKPGNADLRHGSDAEIRAYQVGHRDARHAAAELVAATKPAVPASEAVGVRESALLDLIAGYCKDWPSMGSVPAKGLLRLMRAAISLAAPAAPTDAGVRGKTERDGWESAAKALAERAAGHHRNRNFDLKDECLQCASMLHDMKPALKSSPQAPKQEGSVS